MTQYYERDGIALYQGDALDVLAALPEHSVHCVVTSPPYWGLRNYKVDGQWGSEKTPEEFIERLVNLGRALRRALRPDGQFWLNLGDSYASVGRGGSEHHTAKMGAKTAKAQALERKAPPTGYKPGDLMGMPWRVALALQADGWWLRSDNIWAKPAPMPESVNGTRWERCRVKTKAQSRGVNHSGTRQGYQSSPPHPDNGIIGENASYDDCPGCAKCEPNGGYVLRRGSWRCTKAHEYIFQLTPSATYFADREAVADDIAQSTIGRVALAESRRGEAERDNQSTGGRTYKRCDSAAVSRDMYADSRDHLVCAPTSGKRNPRSVWTLAPEPCKEAHFATFPSSLPDKCIRASTSEKGCCPKCGANWARVVGANLGWRPTCSCNAGEPERCIVLDPFIGSGTTALAAWKLGRRAIGIDLSTEYLDIAAKRIDAAMNTMPLLAEGNT